MGVFGVVLESEAPMVAKFEGLRTDDRLAFVESFKREYAHCEPVALRDIKVAAEFVNFPEWLIADNAAQETIVAHLPSLSFYKVTDAGKQRVQMSGPLPFLEKAVVFYKNSLQKTLHKKSF